MKKFISLLVVFIFIAAAGHADTVWVLCQPNSFVNVRANPKKTSAAISYMECGWGAETNNKSKNGYIFLTSASNEEGCGWVKQGYVVYSEPVLKTFKVNITSNGRVACWRSIGGRRRCWARNGDEVIVYAVSYIWSVTNKGFIKTEYLGVNYMNLLLFEEQELHELTFEE